MHRFIHPGATRIANIGLKARERGQCATFYYVGLETSSTVAPADLIASQG